MDINLDAIDKIISDECAVVSTDSKHVSLPQLRQILRDSKKLVLTPF